jgi:hypothetical protein
VSTTLTDAFRQAARVEHLGDLRTWTQPLLRSIASTGYEAWNQGADLALPHEPDYLHPVVSPLSLLPDRVLGPARRCMLACGRVAIGVSDSVDALNLAVQLEEAIDAGLVWPLPWQGRRWRSDYVSMAEQVPLLRGATHADPTDDEEVRAFLQLMANFEVAAALDECARYDGTLDLACVSEDHVRGLHGLLQLAVGTNLPARVGRYDELNFLPDLMRLPLPQFDLPLRDLVRIQQDGLFTLWHRALVRGLERTRTLPTEDLLTPSAQALRVVREELEEAARQVTTSVRRSRTLGGALTGFINFGLAGAAGALGTLGGPEVAATAAGGAYAIGSVVKWLGGRPTTGQQSFGRIAITIFGRDEQVR